MKKLLTLLLLPLSIFAGSADAEIECKSGSGRTLLNFSDSDGMAMFTGGSFSIDKKKIELNSDYGHIISDFRRGLYVLYYNDPKKDIVLDFYAIPNTMKRTELEEYEDSYKFNAVIGENSTDPREKNRDLLRKTIWLSCTFKYTL